MTFLRFGVVLDKKQGALPKMAMPFYLGAGGRIGSGHQVFSWVALTDVVSALLFLLEHPEVIGPVNIVATQAVQQMQFARALAKILQRPCFLPTPAIVLRAIFGQMADELLLSGQHVLPSRLSELGFDFAYPDIEAALRHIYR